MFGKAATFGAGKTSKPVPSLDATLYILAAASESRVGDVVSFFATVGLESGYNMTPLNNGNPKNGPPYKSVDIGPGQVNVSMTEATGGGLDRQAFGTNTLPGQLFNGNPFWNLVMAADTFNEKRDAAHYVGSAAKAVADRQRELDALTPKLRQFLDCLKK